MVIMSAADRDMSDAELGAMTDMVGHLPVFRDYDKSMITKTSASCVEMLKGEGFDIARRTVAKYREAIGLGSSVQRRRQKAIGRAA